MEVLVGEANYEVSALREPSNLWEIFRLRHCEVDRRVCSIGCCRKYRWIMPPDAALTLRRLTHVSGGIEGERLRLQLRLFEGLLEQPPAGDNIRSRVPIKHGVQLLNPRNSAPV